MALPSGLSSALSKSKSASAEKLIFCGSSFSGGALTTGLGGSFAGGFGGGGGGGGGGFGHKSGVHSLHAAAAAASAGVHALVRMQTVFPTALTTLPSLSVR